jgi:hypothetical protein
MERAIVEDDMLRIEMTQGGGIFARGDGGRGEFKPVNFSVLVVAVSGCSTCL